MLALAGYPLGMQFRFFDPDPHASSAMLAQHIVAPYDDLAALDAFADGLDVVTYEFENVPFATAHYLAQRVEVYPPPRALEITQDRVAEKGFMHAAGLSVARFVPVCSCSDLEDGLDIVGLPAVLKTRRMGYDGKGQRVIRDASSARAALEDLGTTNLVLEEFVTFDRELSLVAARGREGASVCYPLVENHHREGILRETRAPAPGLDKQLQRMAESGAQQMMSTLNYVGCLAIEFFQRGDELIANEVAPRVHNTGHWTIEGAVTSQFENHVRAITGLPLGSAAPIANAIMLNVVGSFPSLERLLMDPAAHVHDYGKSPRPGRKLGHVTLVDDDLERVERRAMRVRALLA